jgi:hypothetical protein
MGFDIAAKIDELKLVYNDKLERSFTDYDAGVIFCLGALSAPRKKMLTRVYRSTPPNFEGRESEGAKAIKKDFIDYMRKTYLSFSPDLPDSKPLEQAAAELAEIGFDTDFEPNTIEEAVSNLLYMNDQIIVEKTKDIDENQMPKNERAEWLQQSFLIELGKTVYHGSRKYGSRLGPMRGTNHNVYWEYNSILDQLKIFAEETKKELEGLQRQGK